MGNLNSTCGAGHGKSSDVTPTRMPEHVALRMLGSIREARLGPCLRREHSELARKDSVRVSY